MCRFAVTGVHLALGPRGTASAQDPVVGTVTADPGTAVDLFNSVINFTLLVIVNRISRRVSETSLW